VIDCRLHVNGEPFADTADDVYAATPTALADLELTWGRATTVDQPDAATCRVGVIDRTGGVAFTDAVPIGATFDVWAEGDISTGAPVETVVDGGFETLPLGPTDRVFIDEDDAGVTATATVVSEPVASGVRAVRLSTTSGGTDFDIPPAPFTPGNPAGWDAIPRFAYQSTWTVSVTWWLTAGRRAQVRGIGYGSPESTETLLPPFTSRMLYGNGDWQTTTWTIYNNVWEQADVWAGLSIHGLSLRRWIDVPTTWAETPDTWIDWSSIVIDNVSITAPAAGLTRDVLVFSGRVTDLRAAIDDFGTATVDVTAVDQRAELDNRYVGDQPWPKESVMSRVGRVITAAGVDVDVRIDTPLDAYQVSWRDVDNQPSGGLLAELAAGIDGVLWSATHATTGAYLWLENPGNRASVRQLALQGGVVVIITADPNRAPGRTVLDGCVVTDDELQWVRDVSDVITRVDATWQEQTLDDEGNQAPTERTVRVVDTPAEVDYGARRYGVSTPLTTATDATSVANRILARTRLTWRAEGLEYDLGLFPPDPGNDTANALDLIDGTTRLGRALIIENVAYWPGGKTVGMYVDGGRYRFDGAWRLGLVGTPMVGVGTSGGWGSLDPTWRWNQMDPGIRWADLWGVAGPVTTTEE
jgi:hypothetical protein